MDFTEAQDKLNQIDTLKDRIDQNQVDVINIKEFLSKVFNMWFEDAYKAVQVYNMHFQNPKTGLSTKPWIQCFSKTNLTDADVTRIAFRLFDIMIERGYIFKKEK